MRTAVLIVCMTACASAPVDLGPTWAPFQMLAGSWDGTGDGATGPSHGHFTLAPDLDGHVLVRRSVNDTAQGKHEDLMIVYRADHGTFRAAYFDGEGHQINYAVVPSASSLVFLSDDVAGAPRFRLTYEMAGDHGTVVFAIAPPGASDLKPYVTGTLQRAK